MFSYIFFSLIFVLVRSFVHSFVWSFFRLLLSLLLFALCIHIRFNSSFFYFVFFIFQYVSFLSCSYCCILYTYTQNKWFESAFFLFRLLYHSFSLSLYLSCLYRRCKPLYHIVNAFVHSKQYYWRAAYSKYTQTDTHTQHKYILQQKQRWQSDERVRIDY